MQTPTITSIDLRAIEDVLDMGSGYVLDFTDRTFAHFFADLGIDVEAPSFPRGSKATRLREYLKAATPAAAARVLEALLAHPGRRRVHADSESVARYRAIVSRLRTGHVGLADIDHLDVLSDAYVSELAAKLDRRLGSSDLDGAITIARTTLEAVLRELERRLRGTRADHGGDLQRLYKDVASLLRLDAGRSDLDDSFKMVLRGLVSVVNGLAPIRNAMGDSHARDRPPAPHEARLAANATTTLVAFLVEAYATERDQSRGPGGAAAP